jgi:hypothetical protein
MSQPGMQASSSRSGLQAATGQARAPGRAPRIRPRSRVAAARLTGRGAILSLFGLSFLGLLISNWLSWGTLGNGTFVAGCVLIACCAVPRDLLLVAVSPPLVFFSACVCVKVATSNGGASAAEGTLVTLAGSAPWLFAGTALTLLIGLPRGILRNIRELCQSLRGDPYTPLDGDAGPPGSMGGGTAPRR